MRCPICRCNLVLKHGKRGDFYGCTNPHCRHTQCVERPIGQKLQSTQVWFRELLSSFKGDPLFEAEGRILELEELIAKSAPLQWVWESDDDAAKQWELEALSLLQKEQAK